MTDLVATLETTTRNGRTTRVRQQAVQVALCVTSGAFNTGLLTYFTQRDLFPSLMRLVLDGTDPSDTTLPFLLTGVLANYNKFEAHNPYQIRFGEFDDQITIVKLTQSVGTTCETLRDRYTAIQNDLPEAWSIGGTLSYVGLGALAGVRPAPAAPTEEEAKSMFAEQPEPSAAILLSTYEFVLTNKLFCTELVGKQGQSALGSFVSFSSYLLQHAHRSPRAASYAHLVLNILRILVEDPALIKLMLETSATVRLCRQRAPFLPMTRGDRPLAAALIDVMVDSINHNLRKRLDVDLYL